MLDDPSRFLKILKRSLKSFEDPQKILKDPSKPFKILKGSLQRSQKDPQNAPPRSPQIPKNPAKIFKDLGNAF